MDRQRNGKSGRTCYSTQLRHAISRFLPQRGLPLMAGDDKRRWTPRLLAIMAVLMAWQGGATMNEAFDACRPALVSMYPTRRRPGRTLMGWAKALAGQGRRLLKLIVPELRRHAQQLLGRRWRWRQWVVLAADGSRVECPRSRGNQRAMGCAGKDKSPPQLMLTTLFHAASGLLWDWRRGGGRSAERTLLRRMLHGLPARSLLLMDAGFTGFELLTGLIERGHDFIVRVGRNVQLLTELGYEVEQRKDVVWLWPHHKRQGRPLMLRCVRLNKGRRRMCLLTSVLDRRSLSEADVADWYRRRWVIEVSYRSLKQTMAKRKMLSRRPSHARLELDWALVGLAMLGLMSSAAQPRRHLGRWSAARALATTRRATRQADRLPPAGGLCRQLRQATIDRYQRSGRKNARRWPHKKNDRPCGAPKFRTATSAEVRLAQAVAAAGGSG